MAQTRFAPAPKFADAVLFHDMPWTDWLDDGETITAFSVTANDAALQVSGAREDDGTVFWTVAGGVSRKVYFLTVAIETSAGRADECRLSYRIR